MSASLDGGLTIIRQCVPCGHYDTAPPDPPPPVAALDHEAVIRSARMRLRDNGVAYVDVEELLATATALLAERQQDKERIERLSEGLILAADALEPLGEWLVNDSPAMPGEVAQPLLAWIERAEEFMAALAVEEDAAPRDDEDFLGPPMPAGDEPDQGILNAWAVEEDATP